MQMMWFIRLRTFLVRKKLSYIQRFSGDLRYGYESKLYKHIMVGSESKLF